jgi:AbrB family looped-hinge helix DNA binding protein
MKTVVSERGQITLPKAIRTDLGIKAGTVLEFEAIDGKIVGWKREDGDPFQAWRGRGRLPEGMASVDEYLERSRE